MPNKDRTRKAYQILCRSIVLVATVGTLGCATLFDEFSGRKEACSILAIGKPASGRIMRLIDTKTTINDDPVVEFVLQVTLPDGTSYEAHTKALISRLDIPSVQPGRVVPVKYDPQVLTRVALDMWKCPEP